jgi:hypothetical protein
MFAPSRMRTRVPPVTDQEMGVCQGTRGLHLGLPGCETLLASSSQPEKQSSGAANLGAQLQRKSCFAKHTQRYPDFIRLACGREVPACI